MKKLSLILAVAVLLAGGWLGSMAGPAQAQVVKETVTTVYPPPPPNPAEHPWVGPNTPWVYYNGDWFYNGTLYYDYGPKYGWAPYYAYETNVVVRPPEYYEPKYITWYEEHPTYYETFRTTYPYWVKHRSGEVYNEEFYIEHTRRGGENRWRRWKREDRD